MSKKKPPVTYGKYIATLQDTVDMTAEWKKTRHLIKLWGIFTGLIFPVLLLFADHWIWK